MDQESKTQYCIPTYGIPYPTLSPSSSPTSPYVKFFRPVKFLDEAEPAESKVTATLHYQDLWKTFEDIGNEMVVTKSGRTLFPPLKLSLKGLDADTNYNVSLMISPADTNCYKYIKKKWYITGESDVVQDEQRQVLVHEASPNTGHFWMDSPISFNDVKITQCENTEQDCILLHPMHKYTIKVVIDQVAGSNKMVLPLPNTAFIAVSSYHNIELIKLKINKNPSPYDFKQQNKDSQNVSKDGLPQTLAGIGEHFKENGHTMDAPTPNESSELLPKENGHTIDDTVSLSTLDSFDSTEATLGSKHSMGDLESENTTPVKTIKADGDY